MTDLVIQRGSTFSRVLRWESGPFIYTPITAITRAAPVSITATAHGLVTGWRAGVVSAGGIRQLNAKQVPPRSNEFHKVTVIDADTVEFNDVDSSSFTPYTSGGSLISYTPVVLTGFTARMQIRATAESADPPLVSLTSPGDIVLDDTNHTITISVSAAVTAAYTFAQGVFDLELASGDVVPVVTKLLSGSVQVVDEVTR